MTGDSANAAIKGDDTDAETSRGVIQDETKTARMIGNVTEEFLLKQAKEISLERTRDWEVTDLKAEQRIPRIHRDEIELGAVFGKGGFFEVMEVSNISLQGEDGESTLENPVPQEDDDEYLFLGVVQDRQFMQRHCMRNDGKDCRYALKTMQESCKQDPSVFLNAAVDLAVEFKFLSAVRHPNIIKMRAVSTGDIYDSEAFLVLDRLYDTLDDRLILWKQRSQSIFMKLFDFQRKREKSFFAKRLLVAYDIASALAYLHDTNIMYRDLKPSNVGFDVRDDAKLFDFGLATEFRPEEIQSGSYRLTGDTGTMRYMAPEVALNHPYTEKADVFSFGVLLWQICALEVPYPKLSDDAIMRKVIQMNFRPKINEQWPVSIRKLLEDCFARPNSRPNMATISAVLRHEIKQISDTTFIDEEDLLESARSRLSARYITT